MGGGPGGRPETGSRLLTLIYVHHRQCEPPKMQKQHLFLSTCCGSDFSSILFINSSKQNFPAYSRLAWDNQRYWKHSYARGSKNYAATFGQRVNKQAQPPFKHRVFELCSTTDHVHSESNKWHTVSLNLAPCGYTSSLQPKHEFHRTEYQWM